MKVEVKLFAIAQQFAGNERIDLVLHETATVGDLRTALIELLPDLRSMADQLRFAVNSEYVDDDAQLCESDEVACIPPVSGG